MQRFPACILTILFVAAAGTATAQPRPVAPATPAPELGLRIGALWPEDAAQTRPAAGGRLALRPWATRLSGRLSLQFTGDFRSLGGVDGYDDFFRLRRRITRNRLVLGGGLGLDLVRTAGTIIDVRVGAALVRTRTNFLIDSSLGFVDDDNVWENVCPFEGFGERCSTTYDATPLWAVGLRRDIVRTGAAYVGVEYSGLGTGHHLLMGSIGMRFP